MHLQGSLLLLADFLHVLVGCFDHFQQLGHLGFAEGAIGLGEFADQVFDVVLFDAALDHGEGVAEQGGVDSAAGVDLSLLLHGQAVGHTLPQVEQQEELPEGEVAQGLFGAEFVEDGSLLGVLVVGAVVGVAEEDHLLDALEIDAADGHTEDLPENMEGEFEDFGLEFEFAGFAEGFDVFVDFVAVVGVILLQLGQELFALLLIGQLLHYHVEPVFIELIVLLIGDDFLFPQQVLLELVVGIGVVELEGFTEAQTEPVFELVSVLPVEDVGLLYHVVDVVLDVADQRDLVHVQLLEKVNKLFFNSNVKFTDLPLPLLSAALKLSHSLSKFIPILLQLAHQLHLFIEDSLRSFAQSLVHLVQCCHFIQDELLIQFPTPLLHSCPVLGQQIEVRPQIFLHVPEFRQLCFHLFLDGCEGSLEGIGFLGNLFLEKPDLMDSFADETLEALDDFGVEGVVGLDVADLLDGLGDGSLILFLGLDAQTDGGHEGVDDFEVLEMVGEHLVDLGEDIVHNITLQMGSQAELEDVLLFTLFLLLLAAGSEAGHLFTQQMQLFAEHCYFGNNKTLLCLEKEGEDVVGLFGLFGGGVGFSVGTVAVLNALAVWWAFGDIIIQIFVVLYSGDGLQMLLYNCGMVFELIDIGRYRQNRQNGCGFYALL